MFYKFNFCNNWFRNNVRIFDAISNFPSNGTAWNSEATCVSLYPGSNDNQLNNTTIEDNEYDKNIYNINNIKKISRDDDSIISENMLLLLKHYHEHEVPHNLLDFLPEKTPAIMGVTQFKKKFYD